MRILPKLYGQKGFWVSKFVYMCLCMCVLFLNFWFFLRLSNLYFTDAVNPFSVRLEYTFQMPGMHRNKSWCSTSNMRTISHNTIMIQIIHNIYFMNNSNFISWVTQVLSHYTSNILSSIIVQLKSSSLNLVQTTNAAHLLESITNELSLWKIRNQRTSDS